IFTAIRSLMELPGLVVSTFTSIVPLTSLVRLLSLTSGVLPMVSSMLLYHIAEGLKLQMFHRQSIVNELPERFNPNGEVCFYKFGSHTRITFHGFHTLGNHGLIRNQ